MLWIYVNNTERSDDIDQDSLTINNQIQQRTDTCNFTFFQGTKPNENEDVRIFMGDTVATAVGATITLSGKFEANTGKFYAGQELFIRIADADEEKVTVLSYNESTLTIVLTAAPSGSVVAGDKIGELIYGGVVSRVADSNDGSLEQIDYAVTCVDYTKIFNKKLISDSWENVNSLYIINSFLNSTVNYNTTIDDLSYDSNVDLQAQWIESGDGNNPTIDTATFIEGTASAVFGWTYSSGTAIYTAAFASTKDISLLVGANTGTPTKGTLMIFVDPDDLTKLTSIKFRLGSDSSNYAEFTLAVASIIVEDDFSYFNLDFDTATITGTPDWRVVDYAQIRIAETATSSIKFNGLRVNARGSFTLFNTKATPMIEKFRAPHITPSSIVDTLAKAYQFVWYINYERNIVFAENETIIAPIQFSDSSNNFTGLSIEVDQSQLGNRIAIYGGEKTSTSTYAQVIAGDGSRREWLLKNKFKNLELTIDNNTSTDTMEATTTTTTIKATAHGLVVGDHIVNRSRSNAVRQVLTVPDVNTFTVEAVTSQASGDTFSKFSVTKTIGIEGLTDETTVDYVANSNEKSIRACASEITYTSGTFLRFEYNERVPLQVEYSDSASQNALRALGLGDGIFDLDPINDQNITNTITAITLAQAKVSQFSNPLINGKVKTDQHGVKAGQVVTVNDTNRGIDDVFLVQTVRWKFKGGKYKDYVLYDVTFGTTLFGVIEFYQKLLKAAGSLEFNEDAIIDKFVSPQEEVGMNDVNVFAPNEQAENTEEGSFNDSNVASDATSWAWETSSGQTLTTRWDLFHWS